VNILRRERLVDEPLDAYVEWRETCARVSDAYRSWASETAPGDRTAFGSYVAALDAEEHAAQGYAGLVRRADRLPWSEHPPSGRLGGPARGDGQP
jgi:hypothetical protein